MREKVLRGIALGTLGTFGAGLAGHYLKVKVDPNCIGDVPESFAISTTTSVLSDMGVIYIQNTINGDDIQVPMPRRVKVIKST